MTRKLIERITDGGAFEEKAGYCRAVRSGSNISVSSTIASVTKGSVLANLDTHQQTHAALKRALQAVTELGGTPRTSTRSRLFLAPGASWEEMARAHREIFAEAPPANTAHYVSALIPQGALVEVELDAISVDPVREDQQPGLTNE